MKIPFNTALPYHIDTTDTQQRVLNAYAALRILAKFTRGDWEPDMINPNQLKYHPRFQTTLGFGLSCIGAGGNATSVVGSRLCFPTEEMAKVFGEKYLGLYEIILAN